MNRMLRLFGAGLLLLATHGAAQAQSCGNAETPCSVPLGSYHVSLPSKPPKAGTYPAVVYFHGAGGSGARIFKNTDMTETLNARGYAVIGPNGLQRPESRFGPGWFFLPQRPALRSEMDFTREMLDDATKRFAIDRDRITLTGFSIGGSLVWYLACQDPTIAAAYAPVSGGFWRPHPTFEDCKGPVKLLHTHGWRDQTVPLEGRPLGGGRIYQGDVFEGFQVWRKKNGCTKLRADKFITKGPFWRRIYTSCEPGTALEFALHPGGHTAQREDWAIMFADWFDELQEAGIVGQ